MTEQQKKTFIRELLASVEREALSKIPAMPETWDGIELRWYLAEKFKQSTMSTSGDRSRQQRKRDYDNEVIVRNL
jgi:hypothetical protein